MKKIKLLNLEPSGYGGKAKNILKTFADVDDFNKKKEDVEKIISRYDALITRLGYKIEQKTLKKAVNLKAIMTATTGLDHIDVSFAESKGIKIISLKGETEFLETISATAEHTFALLLTLTRRIPWAFDSVRKGNWNRDAFKGMELKGKILGIIGLGRVGRMVARYAECFGMKLLFYDISHGITKSKVKRVNLAELLKKSDVISLHIPLIPETEKLLAGKEIKMIKKGAYLINTSRGPIIDEKTLLKSLKFGRLRGAALDVICSEAKGFAKGIKKDALIQYAAKNDNLLLTPHIGGATIDSMEKTEIFIAKKAKNFFKR